VIVFRSFRWTAPLLLATQLPALATSCTDVAEQRHSEPATRYTQRELQASQRYGGAYAGGTAMGDTDRDAAFARWVLDRTPS
jgi:hypothetical protein